ncbi:hypothetical protein ACFQY4_09785 [Catellatospora bangladeshensis]|uniref:Uncharacterized protein n=1 Tax=Catellatospora bangladeshensis TaxID=310355 RepID=A0A8J3JL39_9ACTN|nr:hypothetical protein [Catellatospora bangladeshensis]GIF79119.1 hypothetical protein Cba03nite_04680 [Catellatospora bangladeshensis]
MTWTWGIRWLVRLCDREAMRSGVEVSALRTALVAESLLARQAEELARRACRERDRYRGEAVALHAELAAARGPGRPRAKEHAGV